MTYEIRDNSGSMFGNKKKEQDNHPDRTGSIMVDGKEYWINGWLKKTQAGEPWLSLSVKPKEARRQEPPPAPRRPAPRNDRDDTDDRDIQF